MELDSYPSTETNCAVLTARPMGRDDDCLRRKSQQTGVDQTVKSVVISNAHFVCRRFAQSVARTTSIDDGTSGAEYHDTGRVSYLMNALSRPAPSAGARHLRRPRRLAQRIEVSYALKQFPQPGVRRLSLSRERTLDG